MTLEQHKWLKENAPESVWKMSPDEQMQVLADQYVEDHTLDENTPYHQFFGLFDCDIINFKCRSGCAFLKSLEVDGYTEYLRTQSEEVCTRLSKGKKQNESCALTCHASTGEIYDERTDAYWSIELKNQGEYFEVFIRRSPKEVTLYSKEDQHE